MAEMTAEQALCTLVSLHIVGPYDLSDVIEVIEQQAAEIERLRDLHRSILWFVEEHKKIPNCKKWMPLVEAKARQGIEKEAEEKND